MRGRGSIAAPVLAVSLMVLAGCSDKADEPAKDPVMTKADLGGLKAERAQDRNAIPDGSPYWSCGGIESAYLGDEGWTIKNREFVNTSENWVIDSTVMTNPDADAAAQLPKFKAANDACIAKQEKLPEIDLGAGRFGYESIGGDQTDAVRGYATVGKHTLVLVTTFGLDGRDAPSNITRLLDSAQRRAEAATK